MTSANKIHVNKNNVVDIVSTELATANILHLVPDDSIDGPDAWRAIAAEVGTLPEMLDGGPSGELTTISGGEWVDVRYDPKLAHTFRHSNTAQPLHTDGAYVDGHPNILMFYCQSQVAEGGATIFVDGPALVQVLKAERPELYERLTTVPVDFSKFGDAYNKKPIIQFDERGPLLTWNYYRVSDSQNLEVKELRDDFHNFLAERFIDSHEALPVRLEPGEVAMFHDDRILHGRNGFGANQAGERNILKMGITYAPAS